VLEAFHGARALAGGQTINKFAVAAIHTTIQGSYGSSETSGAFVLVAQPLPSPAHGWVDIRSGWKADISWTAAFVR
jgi:hypothetical protein